MPSSHPRRGKRLLWLLALPALLAVLFCANLLLQTFWAHRATSFTPEYAKVDLHPLLEREVRSDADYETLLLQTGLGRQGIDQLLTFGGEGMARILETQEGFFSNPAVHCTPLLPGRFTEEDRVEAPSVPLALVEPGDILLTFSTHSFGWRHGHAGLVVDSGRGLTLEAVVLGSDSAQVSMEHWRYYSGFLLLRVKDASPEERLQVAKFALEHLDGIPYQLTSGIFGPKAPDLESALGAQCAYLPWYAWQAMGYDLDGDGGVIVTVGDLAASPLLEVVQVYGMDPRTVAPPST